MTGRSPMRSVSAPHGTSVSIPPPVTAAKARPTSPRLSPNSPRRAGAERRAGPCAAPRTRRRRPRRWRGSPSGSARSRGGAPRALAVAPRLGLVAAQRHRAPAPAPGRRAVVEARRARLRGADADARRLGRRAEHARGVERHRSRARGATGSAGSRSPRTGVPSAATASCVRAPACASQPSMRATAAARRRGSCASAACTQASIASRSSRASRSTRGASRVGGAGSELGAHEPQAEVVGRDERLDAPAPALAQRVDEVERRAGRRASTTTPRRWRAGSASSSGRSRASVAELHNHIIRFNWLRTPSLAGTRH